MNIAFTAHRGNNQNMGGYDLSSPKNQLMQSVIESKVSDIIAHNPQEEKFTFFTGGALVGDQLCFKAVENVKPMFPDKSIYSILCMPFLHQDKVWKRKDKEELAREKSVADAVVLVDTIPEYKVQYLKEGDYSPVKMQKRNEFMVDKSDIVVGIWDGTKKHSGTFNALRYAHKLKKKVVIINPKEI